MQDDTDVEAIERATHAALPPDAADEFDGWLLNLDGGTVGRAHSAVPLRHRAPEPGVLPRIEAAYRARGLAPVFRLPDSPAFDAFAQDLRARRYRAVQPTWVMVGSAEAMADAGDGRAVRLAPVPDEAWSAMYLGEGFDPVDGASRVRLLRRAQDALYAALPVPEEAGSGLAAVGCAGFGQGLVGVHGMRTRPVLRGRGLARALIAAMGAAALRRGVREAFLQVDAVNAPALALYARCGFRKAWQYSYWRRPPDTLPVP